MKQSQFAYTVSSGKVLQIAARDTALAVGCTNMDPRDINSVLFLKKMF